jgi:hypothetical protein
MGMETRRHDVIKEHKLGRFGPREEIASNACFLLRVSDHGGDCAACPLESSDASWVAGGGNRMRI